MLRIDIDRFLSSFSEKEAGAICCNHRRKWAVRRIWGGIDVHVSVDDKYGSHIVCWIESLIWEFRHKSYLPKLIAVDRFKWLLTVIRGALLRLAPIRAPPSANSSVIDIKNASGSLGSRGRMAKNQSASCKRERTLRDKRLCLEYNKVL